MTTIRVIGDIRTAFAVEMEVGDNFDPATSDWEDGAFQRKVAAAIGGHLRLGREHALDIDDVEVIT